MISIGTLCLPKKLQPSHPQTSSLACTVIYFARAGQHRRMIYRQVDRRVEESPTAMRADIISSHNLLQIADAEQDEELSYSVLSGSSSSWTVAQKKLFDAGLLHDRAPLGLSALELSDPVPVEEGDTLSVNFTSDLREAEVIAKKPFNIEIGHGLSETVYLQETTIYRQGRERWLLAPPQEKFWGEQTFLRGSRLSLTTPDRDAELAGRLRTDLEKEAGRNVPDSSRYSMPNLSGH